jgi:hypothetical protein
MYPTRGWACWWTWSGPLLPEQLRLCFHGGEYEESPDWDPLFALPAWPAALSAALGLLALAPRRRRQGSCTTCGYDLSGLPTGVCPECGRLDRA